MRKKHLALTGELVWYRFGPSGRAYRLRNVTAKVTTERRLTAAELESATAAEEARRREDDYEPSSSEGQPRKKKRRFSKYRDRPTKRMLRDAARRQNSTVTSTEAVPGVVAEGEEVLVVFGSVGRFVPGERVEPYGVVHVVADLVKYHARKEKHTCSGKASGGLGLDGYEEVVLTCALDKAPRDGEVQMVSVF